MTRRSESRRPPREGILTPHQLVAPGAEGVGELGSTSRLALVFEHGAASLEDLALNSAGAAAVLAGGMTVPVDDFHVRLWDGAPAVVEGTTMTIQPGGARFAVSATVLGESRLRIATNGTPIVVTKETGSWRTSTFSLEPSHGGELWSLVVAPGRWQ